MRKTDGKQLLIRLSAGLGTGVILVALAAGAWAALGSDLLRSTESADVVASETPFAFDGPAFTVAKVNTWQHEVARSASGVGVEAPGDVLLLDDWTYTGIRRTRIGRPSPSNRF